MNFSFRMDDIETSTLMNIPKKKEEEGKDPMKPEETPDPPQIMEPTSEGERNEKSSGKQKKKNKRKR